VLKSILNCNCSPIGLDVGASSIKMLQLRNRGSRLTVIASGQYMLPADAPADFLERRALLVEGIQRILAGSRFRGNRVVCCLPAGWVQYKNVRMPPMPDEELVTAVQWEAADRFQFGDAPANVQYLNAGEVRHGEEIRHELILMGADEQRLRNYIAMLTEAGLRPSALEPVPVALCRCFARTVRRESDQQEIRVVVDIGLTATNVMVLRGNHIVFYKPLGIGGARLHEAVAHHLELSLAEAAELRRQLADDREDDADPEQLIGSNRRENVRRAVLECTRPYVNDLAREIGLCLRYCSVTFRGARPAHLWLTGGEAYDPFIARGIREQLELDVELAAPMEGVDLSGAQLAIERRNSACEWAVALGLAMRNPSSVSRRLRGAA
jgi:type IV pilus assembly protein PilM